MPGAPVLLGLNMSSQGTVLLSYLVQDSTALKRRGTGRGRGTGEKGGGQGEGDAIGGTLRARTSSSIALVASIYM